MPVPSSITDLDSTIANNSPAGSDAIGTTLDDYLRAHAGIIKQENVARLSGTETLTNKTLTSPKLDKVQIGVSGTATNNFTMTAEAADGTMKLARGNAGATTQDVFKVDASGNVLLVTGGLGYGTGAGGSVTQSTNKTTSVTLNKSSGQITMNNAALASGAIVAFTFNNSVISSGVDQVYVSVYGSGIADAANYSVRAATNYGGGSAKIIVKNESGGSLSEGLVINFSVIKGAIS